MHILLIGATGRTGHPALLEALRRGHTITVLARDPSALEAQMRTAALSQPQRSNLAIVAGSPLQPADVARALATFPTPSTTTTTTTTTATDAVVITLNARRAGESPFASPHPTDSPPRMMADSVANAIAALQAQQAQQAKAEGQARPSPPTSPAETTTTTTNSRPPPKIVVLSALGAAKVFDVGDEGGCPRVVPMMSTVSRGVVARFLVDAAEREDWDGTAPILVG